MSGPGDFLLDELDFGVTSDGGPLEDPVSPVVLRALSFELAPAASLENVVLASGDYVRVADGQVVEGLTSNMGNGQVEVGADAVAVPGLETHVGPVFSRGKVLLRSSSTIDGDLVTVLAPELQAGAHVTGTTTEGASFEPPVLVSWTAPTPEALGADFSVPPDGNRQLDRISARSVTVFSRGELSIPGGIRYLDSLVVEPDGVLRIDTTESPVVLYVLTQLDYKG